jgi:hypothetical protein
MHASIIGWSGGTLGGSAGLTADWRRSPSGAVEQRIAVSDIVVFTVNF